jgi:phosphonate transport system substrate-binding protein
VIIPIILAARIGIGYGIFVAADSSVSTVQTPPAKQIVTLAIQPTAQASDIESQAEELEQFLEQKQVMMCRSVSRLL